jgi:hypothetical protein
MTPDTASALKREGMVGLFFHVKNSLLPHTCALALAEPYGGFLTFSESHDDVWRREYYRKYRVDFDYFPRGRVVYNTKAELFTVYIDRCVDTPELIAELLDSFGLVDRAYKIDYDEHYQCHKCNDNYIT